MVRLCWSAIARGGRHVVEASRVLEKAGIGVDLLVCLDVALPPTVPGNVRRVVNLYMSRDRLYPADSLQPAAGSMARIENVDLSSSEALITGPGLNHLNLTASPAVQDFVVGASSKLCPKPHILKVALTTNFRDAYTRGHSFFSPLDRRLKAWNLHF